MRKFKIGAQIQTKEDAKNLVLNLIAGVKKEFAASWLKETTINYMSGSPLKMQPKIVEQMVDHILYDLLIENKLVCEDGIFVKVKNQAKSL